MAKLEHYYTKFEIGQFYHVYNRSVDRQPMFRNEGNYHFFLKQYDKYLSEVIETYSYCLLGNHFHLLIRIRGKEDLATFQKLSSQKDKTAHEIVSHQFKKFFQSYAMAFNKEQNRIGTLFQTPFKRALVDNPIYFTRLVYYIHANPRIHCMMDDFRQWPWSSYQRTLLEKPSKLKKQEVLDWFGDKTQYVDYHSVNHNMSDKEHLFLDAD